MPDQLRHYPGAIYLLGRVLPIFFASSPILLPHQTCIQLRDVSLSNRTIWLVYLSIKNLKFFGHGERIVLWRDCLFFSLSYPLPFTMTFAMTVFVFMLSLTHFGLKWKTCNYTSHTRLWVMTVSLDHPIVTSTVRSPWLIAMYEIANVELFRCHEPQISSASNKQIL